MEIRKNEEKCTNCMLCVKDCSSEVWKDINGIPEIIAPDDCNLCSHCLAVCPQGAIEHEGLDHIQIKKIDTSLINPDAYETITKGRRSIRRYKDKNIPNELVEKIINLANHTPTATNSQNVGYIIVSDKDIISKVASSVFNFAVKIFYFTKKFPGNFIYKLVRLFPASEIIARYLDPMQYYIDETKKGRDFILQQCPCFNSYSCPKRK